MTAGTSSADQSDHDYDEVPASQDKPGDRSRTAMDRNSPESSSNGLTESHPFTIAGAVH